ncbi:hypothetical protein HAX54_009925, partial [Datura stramonium]|nr:hypothetical protein [Datura stramonium]
ASHRSERSETQSDGVGDPNTVRVTRTDLAKNFSIMENQKRKRMLLPPVQNEWQRKLSPKDSTREPQTQNRGLSPSARRGGQVAKRRTFKRVSKWPGGSGVDEFVFTSTKKTIVTLTRVKRLREEPKDKEIISFKDEDLEGTTQPHNYVLIISVNIKHFQIKYVLIDLDSSANVIRWRVIKQMGVTTQAWIPDITRDLESRVTPG